MNWNRLAVGNAPSATLERREESSTEKTKAETEEAVETKEAKTEKRTVAGFFRSVSGQIAATVTAGALALAAAYIDSPIYTIAQQAGSAQIGGGTVGNFTVGPGGSAAVQTVQTASMFPEIAAAIIIATAAVCLGIYLIRTRKED